jgi:hypothetical protein
MTNNKSPTFELPEELGKMVDVQKEDSESLIQYAKKKNVAMLAIIASYVPERISPAEQSYATIGISEEFGVETVLSLMSDTLSKDECELYMLLNSPGGSLESSYEIAKALQEICKKITVFVPHVAASGGTMLALTGHKIFMGRMSRMSPMDVQIRYKGAWVSANAMLRAFNALTNYFKDKTEAEAPYPWTALVDKLDPVIMQKWTDIQGAANTYVDEILKGVGYENHEEISYKLVYEYSYHGEVIDYSTAHALGLNVHRYSEDQETWRLMRQWLAKYLLKSASKHFIRYISPHDEQVSKEEQKG